MVLEALEREGVELIFGYPGGANLPIYQRLPGWSPHPPGLPLDRIALHTRLQTWSLKPATLRG